jgi:hypothetical protein
LESFETRDRAIKREDRRAGSQTGAFHRRAERRTDRCTVVGRDVVGNRFEDRRSQRGSTPRTNLHRAKGAVSDIDGELNLASHA